MAGAVAGLTWLETVSVGRGRGGGSVRDPDGRVHQTLAAAPGDWIPVRPDGYVSARGTGDAELRDTPDRLTNVATREPVRA